MSHLNISGNDDTPYAALLAELGVKQSKKGECLEDVVIDSSLALARRLVVMLNGITSNSQIAAEKLPVLAVVFQELGRTHFALGEFRCCELTLGASLVLWSSLSTSELRRYRAHMRQLYLLFADMGMRRTSASIAKFLLSFDKSALDVVPIEVLISEDRQFKHPPKAARSKEELGDLDELRGLIARLS